MSWTTRRIGVAGAIAVGCLAVALLVAAPERAAGDGKESPRAGSAAPDDPNYAEGVKAIKREDWATGKQLMEAVVAKDDKNANAFNWLAYATRKGGDPTKAIPLYQKALAIDPKHRGAHEYIGEAYLMLDNLPKAKEHLAVLDKLCFLPCEEYSDLKKAVQTYESSGGKSKPAAKGW